MIKLTQTSVEKERQIDEAWRWRFALFPMLLEKNNKAIWIWLEWYETRGGHGSLFQEYKVNGEVYRYVDSGEY